MIKVGMVDDHQLFIDGIKSILKTVVDIDIVLSATSGLVYLQEYQANEIDITITDIRMPEIDGLTLCRTLIKKHPKAKVIILSMYDQPADIREAIKVKASGYLPKNVGKSLLVDSIRSIHQGKRVYPDNFIAYERHMNTYGGYTSNMLTKRETEILVLIAKGRTSKEIAIELHLSKFTIDTHRKNIHKKLGLNGSTALIKYAVEHYK